jgi:NAD(P)-dependent dehydrogenase (short-subunit alcohol dehydrogenase family)
MSLGMPWSAMGDWMFSLQMLESSVPASFSPRLTPKVSWRHCVSTLLGLYPVMQCVYVIRVLLTTRPRPFLAAKHAALAMQRTSSQKDKSSGSIIMTASVAGLRSNAGTTPYSASKATVVSMAQTMAYQLVGTGVRVNALCPGLIETGMTSSVFETARARGTEGKIGQLNPLRRGGLADEIARVALFLGSDESSYVNGQAWAVDGGLSAGHPFVPGKMA